MAAVGQFANGKMTYFGIGELQDRMFTTALLTSTNIFLQVQKDNITPLYVINLLISDVIQLCSMIIIVANNVSEETCKVFNYIYYFGVMAGVGFMMCVSLERYSNYQSNINVAAVLLYISSAVQRPCMCLSYFTGIWSLPGQCGTASDDQSRFL